MKKVFAAALALALLLALATPALAVWGTMFVNKDEIKVYADDDKDSEVITTYKGGTMIVINAVSPNGKWGQIEVDGDIAFVSMKNLSEDMPQKYCDHEWGDWTVEREATCTQTGYRYRYCEICGKLDEDETDKLDHEFGKWEVTKKATCVVKGERTRTCVNCGYEETEAFLEDHSFGEWTIEKQPTCTEKGRRTRTCEVCGAEETEELDMLPHDYEYTVVTEATDHSAGVRAKICRVCGHNGGEESFDPEGTLRRNARGEDVRALQQLLVDQGYLNEGGADGAFGGATEKAIMEFQKDQGLNPDGVAWPQTQRRLQHDFGPWRTLKALTRTESGERVRVCKDCGYEQHEVLEAGEVIEYGARGENVRALQQILKEVGYDAGGFDGIYGKKLDAAFTAFDEDHGLTFEAGRVRPADVDALVNAWLEQDAIALIEGDSGSPVNLALTVSPEADESEDGNAATYAWTLTNLGPRKATFNALLLTYGDEPDFSRDNLVMTIDGKALKADAADSISGSFTVARDWGEGSLSFAAMATDDSIGERWLSNVVTLEQQPATLQILF